MPSKKSGSALSQPKNTARLFFRLQKQVLDEAKAGALKAGESLSDYIRGAYECSFRDIAHALQDSEEVTKKTLGKLAGSVGTKRFVFKHPAQASEEAVRSEGSPGKGRPKTVTGNPTLHIRVLPLEKKTVDDAAAFLGHDLPHFTALAIQRRAELGKKAAEHQTHWKELRDMLSEVTVIEFSTYMNDVLKTASKHPKA